ncbi:helix-turn-helix domain-containing protein [Citrobacter farmeri]|uniref:winged helix-turn-helix transcriptional regulator n=1 Tax=Citrobacter amalonaticus TaxID=35703 RepID=UPI00069C5C73|nr:winged helix-turn-helix transcriptional regulator [Citrobacter amalonaticus]EKV5654383.1 helix-turn-helix domain-containing protein [Citrobacter farmeri]
MNTIIPHTVNIDTAKIHHDQSKPVQDIQRLIATFEPHSRVLPPQADHSLNMAEFAKRKCVLLHTGYASLCRQSDGLVLNTESAPFVFGFSDLYQTTQNLTVYPGPMTKLSTLPLIQAWKIVEREEQWESLAKLLMHISTRLYGHCVRTSHTASYETIRALLLELNDEPEALRQTTPVLQYIQSRCFLSRSGILHILSQLRIGNYITINNGRLIKMGSLPIKF